MSEQQDDRFERIRKAVEARDAFLRDHPELQPLQDEINRLMHNMGTPGNRMALLDSLMQEKLLDLQRRLVELREALLDSLPEGAVEALEEGKGESEATEPGEVGAESEPSGPPRGETPDGLTGRDRPPRPPLEFPRRPPPRRDSRCCTGRK